MHKNTRRGHANWQQLARCRVRNLRKLNDLGIASVSYGRRTKGLNAAVDIYILNFLQLMAISSYN